jgi:hypothetical protein
MANQTAVYWLWDRGFRLLYVGMSHNPDNRFQQHKAEKPWWDEVEYSLIDWHPTRASAATAEAAAISEDRPFFNRQRPSGSRNWYLPQDGGWWTTADMVTFRCGYCGEFLTDWLSAKRQGDSFMIEYTCHSCTRPGSTRVEHGVGLGWVEETGRLGRGWRWLFVDEGVCDWLESQTELEVEGG